LRRAWDGHDRLQRALETDDDFARAAAVEALHGAVACVLDGLHWLGRYRLVRVVALTTRRRRGFDGRVQVLQGGGDAPEAVVASWTAHLLADVVYLGNAAGTELLELSPFVRVLPHPRTRLPTLFVVDAAPQMLRLQLRHGPSQLTVASAIEGANGEIPFCAWLALRRDHGARIGNAWLDGPLQVPVAVPDRAPERERERPMPDLSPAAFRQQRRGSSLFGDGGRSTRLMLLAQVGVAVALVVASVQLVGPRLRGSAIDPDTIDAAPIRPARLPVIAQSVAPLPPPVAGPVAPPPPQPSAPVAAPVTPESAPVTVESPAVTVRKPAVTSQKPAVALPAARIPVTADPNSVTAEPAALAAHPSAVTDLLPAVPDYTALADAAGELKPSYAALLRELAAGVAEDQRASLGARLYKEGSACIYGASLAPKDRRRLGKEAYAEAARLGCRRGWLGLARIAAYGEAKKAHRLQTAQAFLAAEGPATAAELAEARALIERCR
jgi:hypothetical protein